MDWTPDKLIALALVVGCIILVFLGRDGAVLSILSMAAAYFFGTTLEHYRKVPDPLDKTDPTRRK